MGKMRDERSDPPAGRVGEILVRLGHISEQHYLAALSRSPNRPAIDLDPRDIEIDAEVLNLIPRDFCEKYTLIPLLRAGDSLIVAMSDPHDLHATTEFRALTGYWVEPVRATEISIKEAILKYYSGK